MIRIGKILIILFSISIPLLSQVFDEIEYPPLPYPGVSAELIETKEGWVVHGINSRESFDNFFERWEKAEILFAARWNGKQYSSTIYKLDTVWANWGGFDGSAETLRRSVQLDTADNITIMWSTVKELLSDIPPVFVSDYESWYVFEPNGMQKTGGVGSMNDQHAVGSDNQVYYVQQFLQPLDMDTNYRRFSRFRSSVYYHNRPVEGGGFNWIAKVGNGGFPEIKMHGTTPHIIWLESDSSGSRTFRLRYRKADGSTLLPAVTLREFAAANSPWYQNSVTQHPLRNFSWSVDTSGGFHCSWITTGDSWKLFFLHHVNGTTTIDSISSFDWFNANVRYEPNGITNVLMTGSVATNGAKDLYLAVSSPGVSVSIKKTAGPYSGYPVVQRYFRIDSIDYALLENSNGPGIRLVRGIGTDLVTERIISRYHSITGVSLVRKGKTIWIPGSVGGTPVILSMDITDQRSFVDFHFPLAVGDEWHYMVTPHNAPPWEAYPDVHKAVKDTVMKNGKTYIAISSRFRALRYYRKEGLLVFEYIPAESTEKRRFDFSKSVGDTVSVDSVFSYRTIYLQSITTTSLFWPDKRKFKFLGTLGGSMDDYVTDVVDSVGITYMTAVGPTWDLVGAKLSGKEYGTILPVENDDRSIPTEYSLSQNYPNPFNPVTRFDYQIPEATDVTITIYDLLGRSVATLVNEKKTAGRYSAEWNAAQFSSGVYFARMKAGTFTTIKKLTVLK